MATFTGELRLTRPTEMECRLLLASPRAAEIPTFDAQAIARHMRCLHTGHRRRFRLLASVQGPIVMTDPFTGLRSLTPGHVVVIEFDDRTQLVELFGGPTGSESFYLSPNDLSWLAGWNACAGTPQHWPACYVPGELLQAAWSQALSVLTAGQVLTGDRLDADGLSISCAHGPAGPSPARDQAVATGFRRSPGR